MNREEEIIQAADECYPTWEEHNAGFYQGAKWADQHPREGLWDSEKVIDWLKENSKKYVVCYEDGYSHYAHNSLVENLRKAMED